MDPGIIQTRDRRLSRRKDGGWRESERERERKREKERERELRNRA